ncbi:MULTISPECIES: peptidylprolyl isomerase [unclassified Enterococcus]|uniref:peptidylprolyl isomerase n=1 Tax=unclassified Enterococcus TaxID=2608891 RepID=UPI001557FC89|nr:MULTISPECIES: peptidylprolyl isomerase [unclassified Enterococcus]MBS7576156.1 peptidylprolyl isomerase [Enterococcus sp. MMGLQ5-2]MBS7583389.1 peptidylprolyl isomerase [Enterococcus sp. MMGLQ5-1]NPD11249.1 peptidylprolyl isomerase [Enterococcus sp. MMGLQ5-1]NPD35992.1 peptidylprolyl isomerase [Enterococcus sp. MMGLQ5-2]
MKKIFTVLITGISVLMLSACNSTSSSESESSTSESKTEKKVDLDKLELPQLTTEVNDKESVVELETTAGNIKIKLFNEQAPLAVENFITHAKAGYYDNTTFHRVINNFMIQGGDPKGDGTGGESIWKDKDKKIDSGNGFKNEISNQLYNLRGALSMANAGADTNGSQFFINQNNKDQSDGLLYDDYPKKIIEAYKNGGNPSLDGDYTVFGQVIEGMDVVDKIATAEVTESSSGESSTPKDPVKITSVKVIQEAKA